jgi:hypothetical protein
MNFSTEHMLGKESSKKLWSCGEASQADQPQMIKVIQQTSSGVNYFLCKNSSPWRVFFVFLVLHTILRELIIRYDDPSCVSKGNVKAYQLKTDIRLYRSHNDLYKREKITAFLSTNFLNARYYQHTKSSTVERGDRLLNGSTG